MNQLHLSIVLPTFNERNNVLPIVNEIERVFAETGLNFEVIFVDDSQDDTPDIVRQLMLEKSFVKLIHRSPENQTGLGTAILAGINAAEAEIICSMDADLQHPPEAILRMYSAIEAKEINFVVASRMVENGSSEGLSNNFRKFVSKFSSYLAWVLLPLTKKTTDPMTGFFMAYKSIFTGKKLNPIGFKMLVEMLARIPEINSVDVPFVMRKRAFNESKASLKEGVRYIKHLVKLMHQTPEHSILKYFYIPTRFIVNNSEKLAITLGVLISLGYLYTFANNFVEVLLLSISIFLCAQLLYTTYILIYAWDHPQRMQENASPKTFFAPRKSFTAVVPALNEAEVIPYTIKAVSDIDYPEELKETLVVLRDTDTETILAAEKAIKEINKKNVRIQLISGEPFNKPHHLNAALGIAQNEVICIFDAEDEPNKDIYNVVNTVMLRDGADVVQSGVQLMNYDSNWYSMFNVLEYFLWFSSALHFYEKQGVIPLGGNTVFFNTNMVKEIGGWDMHGLTEDADIGIRLSMHGANIRVVYDAKHATQEEAPPTLSSFIKQRTRWSQGFLQILEKRNVVDDIKNFGLKKWALIWYVLGWPRVHAFLFLYIPIAFILSFFVKTHPVLTIINIAPILLLGVFLVVQNVALYEFTRIYKKKWSVWLIPKTIFWFIPYQLALSYSSFRAMVRQYKQHTSWEKTEHVNAHRKVASEVA
jgi:glycosyltransferase XagB